MGRRAAEGMAAKDRGLPPKKWERSGRGYRKEILKEAKRDLDLHLSPLIYWSQERELNSRPTDYESVALPTELSWRIRERA